MPTSQNGAPKKAPEAFIRISTPNSKLLCTEALYRFLTGHYEAVGLFLFVIATVARMDENRTRAAMALLNISPEKREEYEKTIGNPDATKKELRKYAAVLSRNLNVESANSLLCYFSEIVQSAMEKRPELLKSGQQVQLDEIFSFNNRRELISYLIDKQVNSLSYGGILQIEEYLKNRLGIDVFAGEDQRNLIKIMIEVRNIQSHNRGIVNRIFLSRIKNHMGFNFELGNLFHLDLDEFIRLSSNSMDVVINIDEKVAEKFGIRRKRFSTWDARKVVPVWPADDR